MGLRNKVPIFADTNLGTHIGLDVNPTLKASDFKRELEEAHLNCFPKLGNIKINGLMVKRKSYLYHLPDSLCIKHVFHGFRGLWVVQIEASLVSDIVKPSSSPSDIMLSTEPRSYDPISNVNYTSNYKTENIGAKITSSPKVIPSSVGLEKDHVCTNEGGCTNCGLGKDKEFGAISDNYSETILEVVSVSGIIKKYFCDFEDENLNFEVTSSAKRGQQKGQSKTRNSYHCSKENMNEECPFTPTTPARTLIFPLGKGSREKNLRNKCWGGEFGKRLLVASNELRRFKSSQKSSACLYRCKGQMSSAPTYSSLIKSLVFEMSDNDE